MDGTGLSADDSGRAHSRNRARRLYFYNVSRLAETLLSSEISSDTIGYRRGYGYFRNGRLFGNDRILLAFPVRIKIERVRTARHVRKTARLLDGPGVRDTYGLFNGRVICPINKPN